MIKMVGSDERGFYGKEEEEEDGRGKKERAWYLLQAKHRLMIGWRDSAGFLAWLGLGLVNQEFFEARKNGKKSHGYI